MLSRDLLGAVAWTGSISAFAWFRMVCYSHVDQIRVEFAETA